MRSATILSYITKSEKGGGYTYTTDEKILACKLGVIREVYLTVCTCTYIHTHESPQECFIVMARTPIEKQVSA